MNQEMVILWLWNIEKTLVFTFLLSVLLSLKLFLLDYYLNQNLFF